LHLDGVKARKFQQGAKVASYVAVDDAARQGGDADRNGFARARVLSNAADRAGSNDDFIFGAVPFGVGSHGVPE
jgi:hypothetical protein